MKKISKMKMMNVVVICILAFISVSCISGEEQLDNYEVKQIGNCQYLKWGVSYGFYNVAHKGDCDNPIHYKNIITLMDSLEVDVESLKKLKKKIKK